LDGRFIPGGPAESALTDFERMLRDYLGGPDQFTITKAESQPPLDCSPDEPVCQQLLEICRKVHGQAEPMGVNYFADTGPFDRAGIASLLIGPGDIAHAHTADECVDLEQVYQATEIILTLLTSHAGRAILG
jgi:acetylornithine deacetylase